MPSTSIEETLLEAREAETANKEQIPLLSFCEAISASAYNSLPVAGGRGLIAAKSFANAIVTSGLSEDAVAGFSLASIFQQTLLSIIKGAIYSIDTVVADLNGSEDERKKIGALVNQGLIITSLMGVPTTVLFFTATRWLEAMGISSAIAQQAGNYLRALSYGFLPLCWNMVDQNFLLSIKRNLPSVAFNIFFTCAAMGIGFPMTLATKDLSWLGYGFSIAAMLTFLITRAYLFFSGEKNEEGIFLLNREVYNLFSTSIESSVPFSQLFKLGFPTTLQGLSEWLPSILTTFIIASDDSENTAEAQVPSVQLIIGLNQILLALSNSASILVSDALRAARRSAEYSEEERNISLQNAKKLGYATVVVSAGIVSLVSVPGLIYPDPIVQLFCKNEEALALSKSMLQITCATLLIDAIRNVITGSILGRKQPLDNFFTSLSNLIITAGAATVAGFYTQKEMGPLSFFIWKMIGIVVTTAILGYYWESQSKHLSAVSINQWCRWSANNEENHQRLELESVVSNTNSEKTSKVIEPNALVDNSVHNPYIV